MTDADTQEMAGNTPLEIPDSAGNAQPEAAGDATILLPASSTMPQAAALRERMLEALEAHGEITVDAKNVEIITTPVAQVLIAAHRSLEKRGGGLDVIHLCDEFSDCLHELGLGKWLEHWSKSA